MKFPAISRKFGTMTAALATIFGAREAGAGDLELILATVVFCVYILGVALKEFGREARPEWSLTETAAAAKPEEKKP